MPRKRERPSKLTQAIVHELLHYDPHTGRLWWRNKFGGADAMCTPQNRGYLAGGIAGERNLAHRVIWLWMTGEWPKDEIDHKNRRRDDNRWCNLKEATRAENGLNQSLQSNNKTGFAGVTIDRDGMFAAHISVKGKRIALGTFEDKYEAAEARKAAERKYGYSAGHGRAKFTRDAIRRLTEEGILPC